MYKINKDKEVKTGDIIFIIVIFLLPLIFELDGLSYSKADIKNKYSLDKVNYEISKIENDFKGLDDDLIRGNQYEKIYEYLYDTRKSIDSYNKLILSLKDYEFINNYKEPINNINAALRRGDKVIASLSDFRGLGEKLIVIDAVNERDIYKIYYPDSVYLSSLEYDKSILNNITTYVVVAL